MKRDRIQRIKEYKKSSGDSNVDETSIAENLPEQEVKIIYFVVFILLDKMFLSVIRLVTLFRF